ncbi:MAG: response regulator [Salinivirgaceae bacterium]|nr:MAG: response regulator [Salinivirgaceae bacterium]
MNREKILIVDDADNNLLLLHDLLSELNYDVHIANNHNEALKIIDEQKPDLALLDIMMPEVDGFDLFERIKKINPDIKAIFITAKSSEEDRKRAFSMGALDFIVKPVNIMNVIDSVEKALN